MSEPTSSADDVSRETPPAPAQAQGVFGSRLPLAEEFCRLLATEGVVRGVIGPREAPRLWERHLLNCAVVHERIPRGVTVADVGSGAGLPGLVIAIARPDLTVTLVEPLLRRTSFLEEVVALLELDNVVVTRARAEELHGVRHFDVVTSRAVAPLGRLLTWCVPLVSPGGMVLAMKGSAAVDEVEAAGRELRRLRKYGPGEPEVLQAGTGVVQPATTLVRVAVVGAGG